jgi:hypothetical protein
MTILHGIVPKHTQLVSGTYEEGYPTKLGRNYMNLRKLVSLERCIPISNESVPFI